MGTQSMAAFNGGIVKRMMDEAAKNGGIPTFEEFMQMRMAEGAAAGRGGESVEKVLAYHVGHDFALVPGKAGMSLTFKENKGNIFESACPKELEGMLREYDGVFAGCNEASGTIRLDTGEKVITVRILDDTVHSASIVTGEDESVDILPGDGLYMTVLEKEGVCVAVTVMRDTEKVYFEQIKSLYGRVCAIRRFYTEFRDQKSKIDHIYERTGGIKYPRYESSEDDIPDKKIDQQLMYAMIKETLSADNQRTTEALFADPMAYKHKTDMKLNYLSRISPIGPGRKKVDTHALMDLLNKRFYGMEKVKRQILDVLISNEQAGVRGFNMMLVGPAGVGKTSVVQTIAEHLNIPCEVIPMNAMGCPLELEGIDSGYDSADAGRITRIFAGNRTSEMALVLDEIDKMSRETKEGDPMNVLYRMLTGDHEDKFLSCRISTENTIFIATANSIKNIPEPIMNRFNAVIFMDGYTVEDKMHIAREHTIPSILAKFGLDDDDISFEDKAVLRIITDYCGDSGARDLEHNIDMIVRRLIATDAIMPGRVVMECDVIGILEDAVPRTPGIEFNKHRGEYSADVAEKITECLEELKAASNLPTDSDSAQRQRQSLDYLMACRNEKRSFADDFDPRLFAERLHRDLYGMDKVIKEATVFYHAVANTGGKMMLNLLLIGGYGTGKTEISRNIALAMGYDFVKIPLNGLNDARELRGFATSYAGSEPGRIIKGVREAGSLNTVFLLDEIDKLRPELSTVLIDLLDRSFYDSFLQVAVDFRNSIFIATANDPAGVPPVLRDRFITVDVEGYSRDEKSRIVSDYLIPKLEKSYAASAVTVSIEPEAKSYLLETYCPSFGVRDAEKAMQQIVGGKLVEQFGQRDANRVVISKRDVTRFMGEEPAPRGNFPGHDNTAGITKALAVNGGNRGSAFAIETVLTDGDESLEITGLPKETAIDSVKVAVTCIRKMDPQLLAGKRIHVHFGEGAVPKDGPSAGVALFMSIYSAATGIQIMDVSPYDVAFTGEISLTGGVFAVGGVPEKIQGAVDSGCRRVFIPKQNYDRMDHKKLAASACEIVPVSDIRQVIDEFQNYHRKRGIT